MARPRGSRRVGGWMATPRNMIAAGILSDDDIEQKTQGGVVVTQIKDGVTVDQKLLEKSKDFVVVAKKREKRRSSGSSRRIENYTDRVNALTTPEKQPRTKAAHEKEINLLRDIAREIDRYTTRLTGTTDYTKAKSAFQESVVQAMRRDLLGKRNYPVAYSQAKKHLLQMATATEFETS